MLNIWDSFLNYENFNKAWLKIKKNDSVPGIDFIDVNEYEEELNDNLVELINRIRSGVYKPKVVKIKEINKNNKIRKIGILCLEDKIVQQALLQVINFIFENDFSMNSFAYRKGFSALKAVEKVSNLIRTKSDICRYAFQCDIENFFDMINHKILIEILKNKIDDKEILNLIDIIIKAPVSISGVIRDNVVGICSGWSDITFFIQCLYGLL
jgi:retron-type reverse transcriptase